eukprot:EG_transcript_13868
MSRGSFVGGRPKSAGLTHTFALAALQRDHVHSLMSNCASPDSQQPAMSSTPSQRSYRDLGQGMSRPRLPQHSAATAPAVGLEGDPQVGSPARAPGAPATRGWSPFDGPQWFDAPPERLCCPGV